MRQPAWCCVVRRLPLLAPPRALQPRKAAELEAAHRGGKLVRLQQGTAFLRSCKTACRVPADSAGESALPGSVLHAGRGAGPGGQRARSTRAMRSRSNAQGPRTHPEPALQGSAALTPAPRAGAGTRRTRTAAAGRTTQSTRRGGTGSSRGASRAWGEPAPGRPAARPPRCFRAPAGVCGRLGAVGSVSHARDGPAAGASADLPPAPFVPRQKRLSFQVSHQWKPWDVSAEPCERRALARGGHAPCGDARARARALTARL
jgi:hypothetical protein